LKLTSYHINGIHARREEESCITNANLHSRAAVLSYLASYPWTIQNQL